MTTFNRTRIQQALKDAAKAGTFYAVSYNPDSQDPTVDESASIAPTSVLVNEIGSAFELPSRHRMTDRRERSTWTFQLRLKFSQEVLLEVFENALLKSPIKLSAVSGEVRQVTLVLEGSDPTHPVQQEPSTGTQVVYMFEASLSPA